MIIKKVSWATFKNFITSRMVQVNFFEDSASYEIYAIDSILAVNCNLRKNTEEASDFEENLKNNSNKKLENTVTTQYELNDKTLKLARGKCDTDENGYGVIYLKVPGQFGSGQGRYVIGGYGISETYDKDDYVIVMVEDKDRIIAWMVAQAIDPNATEPVADEMIQGMGVIGAIGEAFPQYPMIRSYTDEEIDEVNKGWYFWPLAQGNNLPPAGEIEVNPIGGYGFIPSGFYIKLIYQRPEGAPAGSMKANIDWGRKE